MLEIDSGQSLGSAAGHTRSAVNHTSRDGVRFRTVEQSKLVEPGSNWPDKQPIKQETRRSGEVLLL